MKTFVWGDEFYTGIERVDEQHHGLVDLFNRLSESLLVGDGEPETFDGAVHNAFSQLMDYAIDHFAVEEALMRLHGVDLRHVALHLKLHDDFDEQVRAMWSARAALANPAEVFLSFLTSWLCLHVLGVDQALARQLGSIERGESPQQAFDREQDRPQEKNSEAMIKALRNTYQMVSRLSLELISANRSLEQRVATRTAELQQANAALMVANRKLEVYAQTDGLLGIANRKLFDARLAEEWKRGIRQRHPVALLMIDVDFFKSYNDHYGHLAGDSCLQAVAKAAAGRVVRSGDLLARYGGEEFVALLPNTALAGAHRVALDICQVVSALGIPNPGLAATAQVTLSIGVAAIVPERGASAEQLVAAADRALYAAKAQGRNRVCLA